MAAAQMFENLHPFPDSPMEPDEAYPCKGCGEILEEGKAFELAGNRWHIDCFRCNTCNTLLDSDANLLLLGDGSLICNNCTYSCSNCGNKIEDLAILTGDQAFCASCFKCRNCKRKIENLRYARTSQGIFCMDCHEALMARRRKKTARGQTSSRNKANTEKSLPAIPPPEARLTAYLTAGSDPTYDDSFSPSPSVPDVPSVSQTMSGLRQDSESDNSRPATSNQNQSQGGLTLPSTTYNREHRKSYISHTSQRSDTSAGGEEFLIPLAFDPNPKPSPTPQSGTTTPQARLIEDNPRDYFTKPATQTQSQNASPHVALQDRTRHTPKESIEHSRSLSNAIPSRSGSAAASPFVQPEPQPAQNATQVTRSESKRNDSFKLQEAPRNRRQASAGSTTRAESALSSHQPQPSETSELKITPPMAYEMSPDLTDGGASPQPLQTAASILRDIPKRGDSLDRNKQPVLRKEIGAPNTTQPLSNISNLSTPVRPNDMSMAKANGGKVISAPIASPDSTSLYDTPNLVQRSGDATKAAQESFVEPRAPPAPPSLHSRGESISTLQSEAQKSPKLPRYSGGGDFTLEEDISRILGLDDGAAHESFLRRVSNSVRHGRSYSDRSGRVSRNQWPKSPVGPVPGVGQEISSPSTSSPEHREELAWFKNELRRERQKTIDRDKKISELEAQINSAANISQVNVELREKRSTMVVLDTQKEIVVRELEVLTEQIANAKKSGEPLDIAKMSNVVLRDLAEALAKLKNSFTPQIETLVQQRNDLLEEIANLTQTKDKSFQEFEQLSIKNAQLAEFNNQLVDQIQNIYKSNSGSLPPDQAKPNGLGIYGHQKDKPQASVEAREVARNNSVVTPLHDVGTPYETGEAPSIQSLSGAQVVEMKKGGAVAKRFDWRRGQKMAKGITKGVKGAFASAQQNYGRDMQFAETGAYGQNGQYTQGGQEYGNMPRNTQEPVKTGTAGNGGWFGATKPPMNKNGLYPASGNASTPSLLADSGVPLFGTDLEMRAEYEKVDIPGIVRRCIAEVEDRGMDVEGIYRKSGGNSQVTQVKEGFEKQPSDYDISDPDLDIHAVTSGLKQYFRKLPTPLITYDVYDSLINVTQTPEGPNQKAQRIEGLRAALAELPKVHYDVLEYLIKHLARVVLLEKENLMTPMNIAVVFAPTIMRPESVTRELSDTKAKNEVVMWIVEDAEAVFRVQH